MRTLYLPIPQAPSRLAAWLVAVAVVFAGLPLLAHAENSERGERLAGQLCAACHGVHGHSESPIFPRLSAQTPEYLTAQL